MGNLWVIFVGFYICSCFRFVVGGTNITTDTLVVNKGPPALFVFGDSLVDSGNNNFLFTPARADAPPYGIDLPNHRPSGRFSNGLNIPDILSKQIGSEPTLPFLSPMLTGQRLLLGANFASAGIGILNDTGFQFVNTINMHTQLEYFKQYQQRLKQVFGVEKANQLVNDGLVLISVGGNDFVNNYFLVPFSPRSRQFELPDYVRFLISEYRNILLNLYGLGARRVIVMGTGPLGCVPAELAQHSPNGACVIELQEAACLFNPQLANMLTDLNAQLGADVFFTANTQNIHNDIMTDPQAYGFITSKTACCGQGPFNGMGICTAFSNLCQNRSSYLFWDAFHPTERANQVIVQQMMSGSVDYMAPYNLSIMLALNSDNHL